MVLEKREEVKKIFEDFLDDSLLRIILSNPAFKDGAGPCKALKVRVRPVMLKGGMVFQAEELTEKQAFHRNLTREEGVSYLLGLMESGFKQAEVESSRGQARVLVGKKGTVTIKVKKNQQKMVAAPNVASHNRQKRYILEEGKPVAFLEDLGVMTADGKVVRSRYDKFRQINRFLEFIEDILPRLDKSRENVIIDFGCGKSYLTFAMYYYLHELKGYEVRIIGLDLKQDVIDHCNRLSVAYGFDKLKFYHGDIASYDGVDHVDMVVTLHACDTATDYALEKAVKWDASVILSVPCCQHELNKQMDNELLRPVLQYGLIKERMAALYTDALRAEILENRGYRTQILEFIDMEHTPKNILIRAVKQGGPKDNRKEIEDILQFLGTEQTLAGLLLEDKTRVGITEI
ncbi:methyltransferase family protein [Hungatella effluvii]|uniref:Methyltransferase family protein n=2 Tax=Hungatella effluvii TaxID=1096246 RepID=A0A2V3YIP7_9FIRM|nr:SAM-dependent methyltransferase [Hungatella effluvii]PXX53158.1 methyltransferase family protein [Hungatella effluvii]